MVSRKMFLGNFGKFFFDHQPPQVHMHIYLHITDPQIPQSQVIRSSVESLGVTNVTDIQVVKEKYNTWQPSGMYMTVFLHFADEPWF